jgi:hypothetical protein
MSADYKPVLKPSETKMETAFVIERANYIEYVLKKILIKYISPPDDRVLFLNDIILNNSMLNFGAKVKAFLYLVEKNKWEKIKQEHFHKIINVRNAFAHCDTVTQNIKITMDDNGCSQVADAYYYLESVKSSGKFIQTKREDALHEFTQSYVLVKEYLHRIEGSITTTY